MRTLFTKTVGAAALAAALSVLASCASSTRSAQSPTTTAPPVPSTAAPPTSTPPSSASTPNARTMDVRVYFMRGDKIDVAHRTVTASAQVATAAMTELLAGPTPADVAAGLATSIPASTRLLGINLVGGVATIDLTGAFATGGGSLSMVGRLAQVTYTLTQFSTVTSVVLHLDGEPVTVFGGEGIVLDHPATRSSFESVTPPILVEFPGPGWTVHSPLQVSGSANVFEGQFQAEIVDSSGRVIATQTVHATSGTGTRGSFSTTIAFARTASAPANLVVFDYSPRDGSRIDVVTVPVELSGG